MALIIPYKFVGGTYAKAEEVNDNFAQCKLFSDTLETNIAQHDVSIMELENNKANINGDNGEIFRCANPVTNFDAVNKGSFLEGIWNTLEVIRGLEISKASNVAINIAEGGCYDSLLTTLMRSNDTISLPLESPAANTTYYVYLIGNDVGQVSATFSTNSSSPSMPVGYTLYRNIGYVVTDENAYISSVNSQNSIQSQLSFNGCLELAGGFAIQWGRGKSFQNLTFKKPFTEIYQCTGTPLQVESCTACSIDSLTTTAVRFKAGGHGGSHWDTTCDISYMAIGRIS